MPSTVTGDRKTHLAHPATDASSGLFTDAFSTTTDDVLRRLIKWLPTLSFPSSCTRRRINTPPSTWNFSPSTLPFTTSATSLKELGFHVFTNHKLEIYAIAARMAPTRCDSLQSSTTSRELTTRLLTPYLATFLKCCSLQPRLHRLLCSSSCSWTGPWPTPLQRTFLNAPNHQHPTACLRL